VPQTTISKVIRKIYGMGRGWAFSVIDFSTFGTRSAIDVTLHRLLKRGTIRRVTRGIYDYPRYSDRLETELSPDPDQVARAIARKYGWRIQPSGNAALNLLGLSTQVPSQFLYLSDGPNRTYQIGRQTLAFKQSPLKESSLKLRESGIIVQALRALGSERISPEIISKIRDWLEPKTRSLVLKDTRTVTGWVYDAVRKICDQEQPWNA
jgi:hypothetical protein